MDQVVCLFCDAPNSPEAYYCGNCERSLVVGKLASLGTGVLPKGFTWDLRPKEMSLGRNIANDFVIPSNHLAPVQLKFIYRDKAFWVQQMTPQGESKLNSAVITGELALSHGDILKVGEDELAYSYTPPTEERVIRVPDPTAAQLQLTLGIITGLHASASLQEVLNDAVDSVLRITHTQRGYVFLLEKAENGEVEIVEVAARAGGKNLPERPAEQDYKISRSVIEKVLAAGTSVLIEDSHERGVGSETMHRFSLRSVVCLPLATFSHATGAREVIGVVYCDSPRPAGALPKHCRTALPLLADVITSLVLRWQKFDGTAKRLQKREAAIAAADAGLQAACASLTEVQARVSGARPLSQPEMLASLRDVSAAIARLQSLRLELRKSGQ